MKKLKKIFAMNEQNRKKTLLFVDDERMTLSAYKKYFEPSSEYNLIFADDGDSARKIIMENKIDLVISDFNMPGLNGLQLLKMIKHKHVSAGFILCTGDKHIKDFALFLGADHFLYKPIKFKELKGAILDILKTGQ
ncbi:MAG: response regulator [Bacteriovoracaceae bacterium]|nr:response regulator [Bacteriovoracaceae bacterium]